MTALPLTAFEVEQIRDLRARLNRMAAGAQGMKSIGPLSKGFFDVCSRVGLSATTQPVDMPQPDDLVGAAQEADMASLSRLVSGLFAIRHAEPVSWRRWMDLGVMQAILTRRLVLAGREQP